MKREVIFKEIQVGYDSETGKPVLEKKALDLTIFPKIVVVVDELADLMLTSGKKLRVLSKDCLKWQEHPESI